MRAVPDDSATAAAATVSVAGPASCRLPQAPHATASSSQDVSHLAKPTAAARQRPFSSVSLMTCSHGPASALACASLASTTRTDRRRRRRSDAPSPKLRGRAHSTPRVVDRRPASSAAPPRCAIRFRKSPTRDLLLDERQTIPRAERIARNLLARWKFERPERRFVEFRVFGVHAQRPDLRAEARCAARFCVALRVLPRRRRAQV